MKTFLAKTEDAERKWWVVDAAGKPLGRLATEIANVLRGKNKPTFTPHADTGDFVVVVNADKVTLTGKKWEQKTYFWHSRFFGGMREASARELLARSPEEFFQRAVKGMMPTNKLSRRLITKLKVYKGGTHPHQVQKPEALTVDC
jgi:large subunit ribosomal protein L13